VIPAVAAALELARVEAGLSLADLWIDYCAIGGRSSPEELGRFLSGEAVPTAPDYDVIAQAINDRFAGSDRHHLVRYAEEIGDFTP
jgi:hypothetical protein